MFGSQKILYAVMYFPELEPNLRHGLWKFQLDGKCRIFNQVACTLHETQTENWLFNHVQVAEKQEA